MTHEGAPSGGPDNDEAKRMLEQMKGLAKPIKDAAEARDRENDKILTPDTRPFYDSADRRMANNLARAATGVEPPNLEVMRLYELGQGTPPHLAVETAPQPGQRRGQTP